MHLHVHCSISYNSSTWKQPKCPPMDEWIQNCGIHTQWNIIQPEKKNEILLFSTTQMGLEGIVLSEISQREKEKYCKISLLCGI